MSRWNGWRQFTLPAAVLLIGLGATAAMSEQLHQLTDARDKERFEVAADHLQDQIEGRIETYLAMLRAGAGLFAADDIPTAAAFRTFTERLELDERYPGIQGIGFSQRLDPRDIPRLESAQRAAGYSGFRVWPTTPRDEFHTIRYLEPLDRRNREAIGYDMFSEPTRRAAMAQARDTGEPAASGPVTLVQEIDDDKQAGFLIYVPVYAGGDVPASIAERRRRLLGFVYSPFRMGDLFAGILGRNPRARAGFELFDGATAQGEPLYRTAIAEGTGRLAGTRTLDIAGRRWVVNIFSTVALDRSSSGALIPLVVWAGVLLSTLLAGAIWLQERARLSAERLEAAAEDAASRYQQLANSIPQLAWMARPDGWIYWYNDRWYEYTGTTPEDMAGWGWKSVHDPALLPRVLERWKASLSTGQPFEMEFPLRGADGQFRFFLTRVAPLRASNGEIMHWFGTNTDVQYRRDADKSLREQAATLEALNRTGTRLAGELDLDRLLQTATDAGTNLTRAQFGAFFYNTIDEQGESYTLYTLSGAPRSAFEKFPMPRNTDVFGPTFRGEGIIRVDDITKDPRYGRNAPYSGMPKGHLPVRSYLAAPVRSRSGEVLGGLFFGHADVGVFTEQSEDLLRGIAAQAAIAIDNARLYGQVQTLLRSEREAREDAERVSQLKDQFLATVSHELRTPLNAVLGWAHMLDSDALGEEKRRSAIDAILRNTRIQSHLIEDLLDMSRIMTGRLRLDLELIDVRGVVEAAIDIVRPTAEAKGISIRLNAEADCCTVKADANRLQQIVWNLLSNAIKFTPAGGRVEVDLRATATGQLALTVADNGTGIDADFLPHVFERFRQGDGAVARGVGGLGGLGLGLSIVRSLVEMHAGEVSAHSDGAGKGSQFVVTLPIAGEFDAAQPVVPAGADAPSED